MVKLLLFVNNHVEIIATGKFEESDGVGLAILHDTCAIYSLWNVMPVTIGQLVGAVSTGARHEDAPRPPVARALGKTLKLSFHHRE